MIQFGASTNTSGHRRKIDFKPCADPEVGVQRKRDYPEFSGLRSAKFRLRSKPPRSAERHREIIQLTPGDPRDLEDSGGGGSEEKQAAENERRPPLKWTDGKRVYGSGNTKKGREIKKKNHTRKSGLPAEDSKDRGRPADLHMDRIPGFWKDG